jgi:hypothetical protein
MRERDIGLIEEAYSRGNGWVLVSLGSLYFWIDDGVRLQFVRSFLECVGLFKSRTIWSAHNLISLRAEPAAQQPCEERAGDSKWVRFAGNKGPLGVKSEL